MQCNIKSNNSLSESDITCLKKDLEHRFGLTLVRSTKEAKQTKDEQLSTAESEEDFRRQNYNKIIFRCGLEPRMTKDKKKAKKMLHRCSHHNRCPFQLTFQEIPDKVDGSSTG